MPHLNRLALSLAFIIAGCSPATLGHRSMAISTSPTLPADCAELLELGRDCTVTVPPGAIAAFSDGTSTPITRARR